MTKHKINIEALKLYIAALEKALEHVQSVGLDRQAYMLIDEAMKIDFDMPKEKACTKRKDV